MPVCSAGPPAFDEYFQYTKWSCLGMGTPFLEGIWCSINLGIYAWYIPWFGLITAKEMLKLPPKLRTSMYRSLSRLGTSCQCSKSMVTQQCHCYMDGIIYASKIQVYTDHIFSSKLAGLAGLPRAPGSFRAGLSVDSFCFCVQKPSNSRLGLSKVPQSCVDL